MELRPDLAIIADWIRPGSRVLDLGCGDGTLLSYLQKKLNVVGYGLDIDPANVCAALKTGVNVIQMDLDRESLEFFETASFDYVVMSQALQAVRYPDYMLAEMLRIGNEGILTFPNFGHWRCRWQLSLKGRMPVSDHLSAEWYNTANIHLCTVTDFETLCQERGYEILGRRVVDKYHRNSWFMQLAPNLLGEIALYSLRDSRRSPII
jgi:methionine biosynthesis protein MetW